MFDLNGIFLSQWRWVRCDLSQDRGAVTISGSGECPAGGHWRCLQQRSHSATRYIARIGIFKVIVEITGRLFGHNQCCLELLILYFEHLHMYTQWAVMEPVCKRLE